MADAMRRLYVYVLIMLVAMPLGAIPQSTLDSVIDFSLTLKTIEQTLRNDTVLNSNRSVVIDANIAEIRILDPNEATFQAELILVKGYWIDTTSLTSYRAVARLSGSRYYSLFVTDASGIQVNDAVLVIADIVGQTDNETEAPSTLLRVHHIRVLQ